MLHGSHFDVRINQMVQLKMHYARALGAWSGRRRITLAGWSGGGPAMLAIDEVQYHFVNGMPSFWWLLVSGLPLLARRSSGWPSRVHQHLTFLAPVVVASGHLRRPASGSG